MELWYLLFMNQFIVVQVRRLKFEHNLYLKYVSCPGKKFLHISKEVVVQRNILGIGFNLYRVVHRLLNQIGVIDVVTFSRFWLPIFWVITWVLLISLQTFYTNSVFIKKSKRICVCVCMWGNYNESHIN